MAVKCFAIFNGITNEKAGSLLDNNELFGSISLEIHELKMRFKVQVDENQLSNVVQKSSCNKISISSFNGDLTCSSPLLHHNSTLPSLSSFLRVTPLATRTV
ncbi:hypothetical protein F0562_018379 [Nyssa sinensis]|uniref:Uncharacterized protein n=1 Tax=Nyssa sinensis TaxID=561372 RepID=A0A5J4Z9V3_9ASTE|nr:hypothetical protein F0562_018379 [Nyssa sinensis]